MYASERSQSTIVNWLLSDIFFMFFFQLKFRQVAILSKGNLKQFDERLTVTK